MLALLFTSLFLLQDPAPKPADQQGRSEPAPTAPNSQEVWDDRTAKAKLKDFDKQWKAKPSMGERKRLLDELGQGHNKLLVKSLAKVVETDESVVIRKHAVDLLLTQPTDELGPALTKLLGDGKVTANAAVQAALIRGVAKSCYTSKQWSALAEVFESDYETERVPVHEAILDLVIQHKEAQAVPMLLRNFDEPSPKDVNGGENPPAEYWKARWHSWSAWRPKVKEALFAITGQQFADVAEAKAWLDKNPLPKSGKGGDDDKGKKRR
ncbi:MAG: hypothetical protein R3F29_06915 [Planctomycetota bacterium]